MAYVTQFFLKKSACQYARQKGILGSGKEGRKGLVFLTVKQ